MQPEFYQPNETPFISMILILTCLMLACVIIILAVKLSEAKREIRYHKAEVESFHRTVKHFNAKSMMPSIQDVITDFHEHLDSCEQCRNHPFNLCEEGMKRFNALRQTTSNSTQEVDGNPLPVRSEQMTIKQKGQLWINQ